MKGFFLIITILCCLFHPKFSKAQIFYASIGHDIAWVVSDNEDINGASGNSLSLAAGWINPIINLEIFFKGLGFKKSHTPPSGAIQDIEIEDTIIGIGTRANFAPFATWKLGLAYHIVEATFVDRNGNVRQSTIDSSKLGHYGGVGLISPVFLTRVSLFADFSYHRASSYVSEAMIELGLRIDI